MLRDRVLKGIKADFKKTGWTLGSYIRMVDKDRDVRALLITLGDMGIELLDEEVVDLYSVEGVSEVYKFLEVEPIISFDYIKYGETKCSKCDNPLYACEVVAEESDEEGNEWRMFCPKCWCEVSKGEKSPEAIYLENKPAEPV